MERDIELCQAIDMATAMLKRATVITLEFSVVDNGDGTLSRAAERLVIDLKPIPSAGQKESRRQARDS
jgi:hypothetical protein